MIVKGEQRDGDLEEAQALMARHGALESAHAPPATIADRARAALAPLPDLPLRDHLLALADFVVARVA